METTEIFQGLEGDKLYQKKARVVFPILIRQAGWKKILLR